MKRTRFADTNDTFGLLIPQSGIFEQPDSPSPEAEVPAQQPSARIPKGRGMSKASGNEDDLRKAAGNSTRGRPRVDGRGESAAERRRTQIRLAQRAYRERKEATITSLEARVQQLEQLVGRMHRTFADYADNAIASGLAKRDPALGQGLHGAMERFVELLREAEVDADGEGDGGRGEGIGNVSASKHAGRTKGIKKQKGSEAPVQYAEHAPGMPDVQFAASFVPDAVEDPARRKIRSWGGYNLEIADEDDDEEGGG